MLEPDDPVRFATRAPANARFDIVRDSLCQPVQLYRQNRTIHNLSCLQHSAYRMDYGWVAWQALHLDNIQRERFEPHVQSITGGVPHTRPSLRPGGRYKRWQ